MFDSNIITIIVVTDNHYVILLAALLKSIEKNHKSAEKIHLYIVEDKVNNKNKIKLRASVCPIMITIHWVKMTSVIPAGVRLPIDLTSYPLNIYVRLFSPNIVPSGTEKALFLDVDLIFMEDISKIWNTQLGNNVLGAVQDSRILSFDNSWGGILNYQKLGFDPNTKYFNTGLLLININMWKKQQLTQRTLNCVNQNIKYANYPEQYGLNVVLANQWIELDARWNYFATGDLEGPFVIHFISRKPIYKSYNNNLHYKEIFYNYLKLTLYKSTKPVYELNRYIKKFNNVRVKVWHRLFVN